MPRSSRLVAHRVDLADALGVAPEDLVLGAVVEYGHRSDRQEIVAVRLGVVVGAERRVVDFGGEELVVARMLSGQDAGREGAVLEVRPPSRRARRARQR